MPPIYQYECDSCGVDFTEIRCIADRNKRVLCPASDCGRGSGKLVTAPVRGIVKNPAVPRKTK